MEMLIAAAMILSMILIAVRLILKKGNKKSWCILVSAALVILLEMAISGNMISMSLLTMNMMPSVVALWLLSSSFSGTDMSKWAVRLMFIFNLLLLIVQFCRMTGSHGDIPDELAVKIASSMAVLLCGLFFYGIVKRVGNVKTLMKNAGVWAVVCIYVDAVYLGFSVAGVALLQIGCSLVAVPVLGGVIISIGYRILNESAFVFRQNHERVIVESMKVVMVQGTSDKTHIDEVYKELYDRVVAYFETYKPYLDSELTIHSLVKDLYSNKLYISRAISHFTGRNFCQFVNYYRVMFSMESFRDNPELKVHELATLCGFNSLVSYNMAFRLFMGETPSEWCRKERTKLIKKK